MASPLELLCGTEIGSTEDTISARDGSFFSRIFSGRRIRSKDQMYLSSEMLYHTKRATELLKKGRTRAALLNIERVMAIAGDNPQLKNSCYLDALIAWSEASYNLKFYNHARRFLDEALQIDPNNLRSLVLHGKANRKRGHSRVSDKFFNRTILKWVGHEKTEYITPDYDKAIDSLEKARSIIESDPNGALPSEKKKYARQVYLHLGGSYRSAIEENALPSGDPLEPLVNAAEAYHKAFLAEPKATDEEAINTHTSLVFLYTEIGRLKKARIRNDAAAIDQGAIELYHQGVAKTEEFGWEPKIEASNKLREAYRRDNNYLDPLASLAKLHAGLAKHVSSHFRK